MLVNSQSKCTHGTKLNALESPFGLFWDNLYIVWKSSRYISQRFLRICVMKIGENCRGKYKGNRTIWSNIKTRISCRLVAVFAKTFYHLPQQKYPSRSPWISQEVKYRCADCFIFSWKSWKIQSYFLKWAILHFSLVWKNCIL